MHYGLYAYGFLFIYTFKLACTPTIMQQAFIYFEILFFILHYFTYFYCHRHSECFFFMSCWNYSKPVRKLEYQFEISNRKAYFFTFAWCLHKNRFISELNMCLCVMEIIVQHNTPLWTKMIVRLYHTTQHTRNVEKWIANSGNKKMWMYEEQLRSHLCEPSRNPSV